MQDKEIKLMVNADCRICTSGILSMNGQRVLCGCVYSLFVEKEEVEKEEVEKEEKSRAKHSLYLTKEGYPTEKTLERVRSWKPEDAKNAIRFIRALWQHPGKAHMQHPVWWYGRVWCFTTGGWSGNEQLIDALRENTGLWPIVFAQERVGGYFWFSAVEGKSDG